MKHAMDRMCYVAAVFVAGFCVGSAAQEVENAGFSQGKTNWQGDGRSFTSQKTERSPRRKRGRNTCAADSA
jgi:hypothetical protein